MFELLISINSSAGNKGRTEGYAHLCKFSQVESGSLCAVCLSFPRPSDHSSARIWLVSFIRLEISSVLLTKFVGVCVEMRRLY